MPTPKKPKALLCAADEFGERLIALLERFSADHPELTLLDLVVIVTASYQFLAEQLAKTLKAMPKPK